MKKLDDADEWTIWMFAMILFASGLPVVVQVIVDLINY